MQKEFVHHIVEEEADGQEEKQDDRREETARRGKGRSRGESNTQFERMKMTHEMM